MASGVIKQPTTALSFTVTLGTTWTNNMQTVTNNNFIANGYTYLVSPAASKRAEYLQADIYAGDVTTDTKMTFYCSAAPSEEIPVNILRVVTG